MSIQNNNPSSILTKSTSRILSSKNIDTKNTSSTSTKVTNTNKPKSTIGTTLQTSTCAGLGSSYAIVNVNRLSTIPSSSLVSSQRAQAALSRGPEDGVMDETDMLHMLEKLRMDLSSATSDRDKMKEEALAAEKVSQQKKVHVEMLANSKGLIWNGSSWAAPADEEEIDSDSIALHACILDLSVRNKYLEKHIHKMQEQCELSRSRLVKTLSGDKSRPENQFQMNHELEKLSETIENQRMIYLDQKKEHEKVVLEMSNLLEKSREDDDNLRLQIDQTASMLKFYFDTKSRLEAKCAALQSIFDSKPKSKKKAANTPSKDESNLQSHLQRLDQKLNELSHYS